MTALPSAEALKTMRGSAVLALCLEALRDEADWIRQSQEALIKAGHRVDWDAGRARSHHCLSAVAAIVERWVADAKRAQEAKKHPHSLILDSADIARAALIGELLREVPAPARTPSEDEDAAA